MHFSHSDTIWKAYPRLAAGALAVSGISPGRAVSANVAPFHAIAADRLAQRRESDLPEIQAWRRTFVQMGLKPTQYRCASEALLRRFRKEGALPQIHPLVDLCNAVSLAFAIPVAAFDTARITGDLEVRYAVGNETYVAFSGENESPAPGEVIFADSADRVHARRWTNRQSAESAIRTEATSALIVAEAMHDSAAVDVARLIDTLAAEIAGVWPATPTTGLLSAEAPRFDVATG